MRAAGVLLAVLLFTGVASAQLVPKPAAPAAQPAAQPAEEAPPKDPLGRDTPRGALVGFMDASRSENTQAAVLYLDTPRRNEAGARLAHQLYVVIDKRLPARFNELSDRPEGSQANPLKPNQDVLGTITTAAGPLDIIVERVERPSEAPVWLFSRETLEAIPDAYEEVDLVSVDRYLPEFLFKTRIAGIRLFEWLSLVIVVPLCYWFVGVLGRLFRPVAVLWARRLGTTHSPLHRAAGPARLIVLAVFIRWSMSALELPLRERVFWSWIQTILAATAIAWLLLLLNAFVERRLQRRFRHSSFGEVAVLLRVARRLADGLVIVAAVLVTFYTFGFNPTPALAGLGIGGIAVALAAQKTLENVIGGLSIAFDNAVRVGDFVKVGDTLGTVESVGLRSTRIRTLDRTMLTVPNGQMASVNIDTLSARDKFWFHHFVGLRYETASAQLRSVVDGVHQLLAGHPAVDPGFVRVRFLRLGAFSLDIEVSTYIVANDWEKFLEIQQDLLLRMMEVIERAGTAIALPSQTLRLADARSVDVASGHRLTSGR